MSKKSVAKGTLLQFIAQVNFIVLGYLTQFILTRTLPEEQYGVFSIVTSVYGVLGMLLIKGIPQSISKAINRGQDPEAVKATGIKYQIATGLGFFVIYQLCTPLIAYMLNDDSLIPYFRLSGFIPLFSSVYVVFMGYYNGKTRFGPESLTNIAQSVLKIIFFIIITAIHLPFYSLFVAVAMSYLLVFVANVVVSGTGSGSVDWKIINNVAFPMTLYYVFMRLYNSIDIFALKSILNDNYEVAIYNSALFLGQASLLLSTPLSAALFPFLAKALAQNKFHEACKYFDKALRYFIPLVFAIALFLSFSRDQTISLLYTSRYLSGSGYLIFLSISYSLMAFFHIIATLFMASNKTVAATLLMLGGLLLGFILNYVLIPIFQVSGAYTATLISSATMLLVAMILLSKFLKMSSYLSIFLKNTLAFVVSFGILILLPHDSLLSMIAGNLLIFVTFFGILYLTRAVSRDDIRDIKLMFVKK